MSKKKGNGSTRDSEKLLKALKLWKKSTKTNGSEYGERALEIVKPAESLGHDNWQEILYDPEGERTRKKLSSKYNLPKRFFD